ncbi:unnamed protein product [Paramecium primaurelia]|uniref:Uncharacterized protein n=1 Tax=Paramecium primaurelia TaxID=5886 RepID=A0A8S1P8V5_PARPR|nr:unnamed protein product [Paramecium primaurelia]
MKSNDSILKTVLLLHSQVQDETFRQISQKGKEMGKGMKMVQKKGHLQYS